MRFYKTIFSVKVFFMLCALLTLIGNAHAQTAENKEAKILITMKRDGTAVGCVEDKTADFLCPSSYSISIADDGTVIYEGLLSVKVRGNRTFSISQAKVKELVSDFERIKFFNLKDKYVEEYLPNGITRSVDHAVKTYLTFKSGDKIKTIYNFYGAPKELNDLQGKLDQISKHLQK